MSSVKFYPPLEEKLNVASHALGLFLGLIAVVLLLRHENLGTDLTKTFSVGLFGFSLIILYASSTFYHQAKTVSLRLKLRVLDHVSVYLLIAGTYSPFVLITLNSPTGWGIFYICWGMVAVGSILKIFFTGRFKVLSTLMYVFMGWMIVFAWDDLMLSLHPRGVFWLITGGASYTIGAILYAIKGIRFNHAIFHLFVLIGSVCHFIAIYFYVLGA